MNDVPVKLKPFLFHGVDFDDYNQSQAVGTCPFCDKEHHFHVNTKTGQFHCKICEAKGNIPSFLKQLHDAAMEHTTAKDYKELAEERNVPVEGLKAFRFAKNYLTDEWLIPAYNDKKRLANLFKAYKDNDGWKVISSPECKLHPFGVHLSKNQNSVDVCEGPWDAVSYWCALNTVKQNGRKDGKRRLVRINKKTSTTNAGSLASTTLVLAVPGANTFDASWLTHLEDKDVRLLYDNDHPKKSKTGKMIRPGWDGMRRVAKIANENGHTPKSLERIMWNAKTGHDTTRANGYDIKDLVSDEGNVKTIHFIDQHTEPIKLSPKKLDNGDDEQEHVEPIERTSFKALCDDFNSKLYWTQTLQDTLAVMLAVTTSTELDGDQLWLRIIGPPASGKTTLAECITAAHEYTMPRSIVTGFHSGFVGQGSKKQRSKDASLIPQMNGKTVIIKDGDTLLTAGNRDKILAELRDLYDGTSRAQYRNRQTKLYSGIKTTFLICATDEIRSLNRSFLGERFIDVEILGDEDSQPYLDRAVTNTMGKIMKSFTPKEDEECTSTFLKQVTAGFVNHLKSTLMTTPPPTLSDANGDVLKALGQLLSFMRARANRERGAEGALAYRPRAELATRLVGQFTKLAFCIAVVLGKKTIDREVIRIVRKVVRDTAEGFQFEITQLLMAHTKKGLCVKQISLELALPQTSVTRYINDMMEFGIVERREVPNRSGIGGRNRHLFFLSEDIRKTWIKALGKKS